MSADFLSLTPSLPSTPIHPPALVIWIQQASATIPCIIIFHLMPRYDLALINWLNYNIDIPKAFIKLANAMAMRCVSPL
jgi:hypothetical protein